MKIKTIDVQAKEWFDKVNGNSYFGALVTINYGMKTQKQFSLPFQYGYGDHYKEMAKDELVKRKLIKAESNQELWRYCQDNNIILRASKHENCRKRDVLRYID